MNQAENKLAVRIREVTELEEFRRCIELQREAFRLPDLEISPLRHFIVSKTAGGFTLGAFVKEKLVGFVHHLVALREREIIGYSHMTAIAVKFQNSGIGASLKWAQRAKALEKGQRFIKWTFDPMQTRNANFNLNKLGAVIRSYAENYYGTDYTTTSEKFGKSLGLDSDRLFAEWELDSQRVKTLEKGDAPAFFGKPEYEIEIAANWGTIVKNKPTKAREEQLRVRNEFQTAFAENLVCAGFERGTEKSKYLFYKF